MSVCPSCHAEYRAGFTECSKCHVDLVDAADLASSPKASVLPQVRLADVEKLVIPQGNLTAARELEKVLLDADIPCYVHAEEADIAVALGSTGALMYGVVIAADQVEEARGVFRGRFEEMLAKDGLSVMHHEAVDVEADEVTCPACGHQGPLNDGECADCGLNLGLPG